MGRDFCCQLLSSLRVLMAQQGQKWVCMLCQPQDLWLTDCWFVICKKTAAVCLACAKPSTLTISQAFGLEICASATFLEMSSRSLCRGHRCWISRSMESQHSDPPPTKLERCQQSFAYYIPRKTCWDNSVTTQGVTSSDRQRKKTFTVLPSSWGLNSEILSFAFSHSSEDWDASTSLF